MLMILLWIIASEEQERKKKMSISNYRLHANCKIPPHSNFIKLFYLYCMQEKQVLIAPTNVGLSIAYRVVADANELNNFLMNRVVACDFTPVVEMIRSEINRGNDVYFAGSLCDVQRVVNALPEDTKHHVTFISWKCEGQISRDTFKEAASEYTEDDFAVDNVSLEYDGYAKRIIYNDKDGNSIKLYMGKRSALLEGLKARVLQEDRCFSCSIDNQNVALFLVDGNDVDGYEISANDEIADAIRQNLGDLDVIDELSSCEANIEENRYRQYYLDYCNAKGLPESVYNSVDGHFDIGLVAGYLTGNIGGTLTQMAMYRILTDMGYSVLMIERPLHAMMGPDFNTPFIDELPYKGYEKAEYYTSSSEMVILNNKCRMFMVGSDQFMNTYLYHNTDKVFSLNWVYEDKPKVSYGTSFGFDYLWDNEEQLAERKMYLSRFKYFSVREKSGVQIMKNQLGIDAELVIDPVFLCDKKWFDDLESLDEKKENEEYIFCFILNPTKEKEDIIRRIEEHLGLKAVVYSDRECLFRGYYKKWSLPVITDEKLSDWISGLKNSKFVITDSFHGTCFSIIYQKNFCAIENPIRGKTRFDTFRDLFQLDKHIISDESDVDPTLQEIDYKEINAIILKEKERCRTYLKNAIDESLSYQYTCTPQDILLNAQLKKKKRYNSLFELGLSAGTTVDDIIQRLPNNSEFHQVQGASGKPLVGLPFSYGVLEIYKTTDYFVKCVFYQMTLDEVEPYIYQAKIKNQKVVSWTRYTTEAELDSIKEIDKAYENSIDDRLNNVDKDLDFLIRKYSSLI